MLAIYNDAGMIIVPSDKTCIQAKSQADVISAIQLKLFLKYNDVIKSHKQFLKYNDVIKLHEQRLIRTHSNVYLQYIKNAKLTYPVALV